MNNRGVTIIEARPAVPAHLIRALEMEKETEEEIYSEAIRQVEELMLNKHNGKQEMIRIRTRVFRALERSLQGRIGELVSNQISRSTDLMITKADISMNKIKAVFINKFGRSSQSTWTEEEKELMEEARLKDKPIIILGPKAQRGANSKIQVNWNKSMVIEMVMDTGAADMRPQEPMMISIIGGGEETRSKLKKILEEETCRTVNNMYEIRGAEEAMQASDQKCPVCGQTVKQINEFYVQCGTQECLTVFPKETIRDIRTDRKRKVETLVIDCREEKGCRQKTFWTDGSGQKDKNGIQLTGWGVVECGKVTKSDGTCDVKPIRHTAGTSADLTSVPQCEIRAILWATQQGEKNSTIHVHTDSKTTVQTLRELSVEGNYRRKRAYEHKKLIGEIAEVVKERNLLLILEWVKGHEDMNEESHNWISRMKMQGNEWADEVAKMSIHNGIIESGFPLEEEYTFRHAESGKRISLKEDSELGLKSNISCNSHFLQYGIVLN